MFQFIIHPETIQIEVRIASGEPNNISLTILDNKNIINIIQDCAKDGGEEFVTEMLCIQIANL